MSLAPLLAAPAVIQLHAFAALGAFALGVMRARRTRWKSTGGR
jgi:uncharacterized membrane protein